MLRLLRGGRVPEQSVCQRRCMLRSHDHLPLHVSGWILRHPVRDRWVVIQMHVAESRAISKYTHRIDHWWLLESKTWNISLGHWWWNVSVPRNSVLSFMCDTNKAYKCSKTGNKCGWLTTAWITMRLRIPQLASYVTKPSRNNRALFFHE